MGGWEGVWGRAGWEGQGPILCVGRVGCEKWDEWGGAGGWGGDGVYKDKAEMARRVGGVEWGGRACGKGWKSGGEGRGRRTPNGVVGEAPREGRKEKVPLVLAPGVYRFAKFGMED